MKSTSLMISLAFAASLATGAPWATGATHQVLVKNFMFSPMTLTVSAGTTVIWKNLDGEPHLVVSLEGKFRSPALDQNDTFSYKFEKPGTYEYICTIHPQMRGTITVR